MNALVFEEKFYNYFFFIHNYLEHDHIHLSLLEVVK
jgi:hypothetical protein